MKRNLTFALVALVTLMIATLPPSAATSNLVESGNTHNFDSTVVSTHVLADNTILVLQSNGFLFSMTIQEGRVSELWSHDLAVNATFAKLDSGEKLLAVIHNQGYLTFNIDTKQIEYNTELSSIPDSLDWDNDGEVWLAYHSGIRKAREYSGGTYTNYQTSTVSSGFFSFEVIADNSLVIGGFDSKLHVFDEFGSLITQKSEPNSYLSSMFDTPDGVLLVGSGDGQLHRYDYNNSWTHSVISLGSDQITSIQEFDDTKFAALDSSNVLHMIDKVSFAKVGELPTTSTAHYALAELAGQVSLVYNSGLVGGIMYYDIDSDGDGTIDSLDDFPTDVTQQTDTDGDGYGDNADGISGDLFPNNPEQHEDSDGDGYGDNKFGVDGDLFPDNSEQWADTDSDGYGDNSDGLMGDQFIDDSTQWNDSDGDGYGDNPLGNSPDSCPNVAGFSKLDRFGCLDSDFDFYSNPDADFTVADGADALPNDGTQWLDMDGDGYGDNQAPANNPDSCPSVAGNSTQEIRLDGAIISKFGCLDSDGDSFDDLSDEFPDDQTEWFDADGDTVGSNTDYDDSEPLIATEEDYCKISGNQSNACKSWNDLDYQEYLNRDKADGETDLSYSAWLAQKQAGLLEDDDGLASDIKDVAIVGGGIFVVATALILLGSFIMKRRKLSALVKRYGVPFQPKDENTANQEALEGTAGLSATGGIEADESWDDEVAAMDFTEKQEDVDVADAEVVSADDLYDTDADMSELAGMDIVSNETSEADMSAMLQEESKPVVEEKPSNTPPLPETGLPEGWTMEQWEWYGHEWLAKFGNQ